MSLRQMQFDCITSHIKKRINDEGFSFFEIIIAIIAASILSLIFVQFIGGSFIRSTEPLQQLDDGYELRAIMENITAHYRALLLNDGDPLETLITDINAGNNPGSDHYFGDYSPTLKYLTFSGDIEQDAECSPPAQCPVLKVTIEQNDQSLTALFTR